MPGDVLVGQHRDHRRPAGGSRTPRRAPRPWPRMPCGLCAASTRMVGARRTASSRPGRARPRRTPPRTMSTSSGRLGAGAEERLDRGQRQRRVLGLVGAVQRQEDLVVDAAESLEGEHLAADRDAAGRAPRTRAPRGRRSRRPRRARRSSASAASGGCAASTAVAPALMMPAFSMAIVADVVAEVLRCGRARSA